MVRRSRRKTRTPRMSVRSTPRNLSCSGEYDQIATLEAVARERTAEAAGATPSYVRYVPNVGETSAPRDLQEALLPKGPSGVQRPHYSQIRKFIHRLQNDESSV